MSTTNKSFPENIEMRQNQTMNSCWFVEGGKISKRICYGTAGSDPEFEIYYRVKSVPLEAAKGYLQWIKDNIYEDFEFDDYTIKCKAVPGRAKNTLFVFSMFRLLWESNTGPNKEQDNINIPIITETSEGKFENLGEFLIRYYELMKGSPSRPHSAHSLLCPGSYYKVEKEVLENMDFSKEAFLNKTISNVQTLYKTFQKEDK